MRLKPTYRHRITDNVYIIYKLSHYSRYPIQEIEAGLAFDDCEYSKPLKKALDKYDLDIQDGGWTTASTHTDFCSRLYLKHFLSKDKKYKLPSNVASLCKHHFNIRMEKLKEELNKE